MKWNHRLSRSRYTRVLVLVLVASFLAGLVASVPQPVDAQRARPGVTPRGATWCGLADGGGSVRMEVSRDGRWVLGITIRTDKGSLGSGEGTPVDRAQIVDSKFIFRQDRSDTECRRIPERGPGSRCTRAPCRPRCETPGCRGREECTTTTTNEMSIRGTFTTPESVRGTYTALQTFFVSGRSDKRDTRKIVGNFIAWPADVAPCP